jgi:hypothetical protein
MTALPVITAHTPITLNAGALTAFHQCPRKFYYQALLRLPSPPHDSAELGHLWHSLMQAWLTPPPPHTLGQLAQLVQLAVMVPAQRTIPYPAGLPGKVFAWLDGLLPLHRRDVCYTLQAIMDNLQASQYPVYPAQRLLLETPLSLTLDGLGVTFSLRLDMAWQDAQQGWHVVDYKVFQNEAFTQKKPETRQEHLLFALNTFNHIDFRPTDTPESHRQQFGLGSNRPLIYQLPLYWLAFAQTLLPQYGGVLASFSLDVLRDSSPWQPVTLPADDGVYATMDAFITQLTEWVTTQLHGVTHFAPSAEGDPCRTCSFTPICPQPLAV